MFCNSSINLLWIVIQAEEWVSERMQKMQEDSKMDLSNLQAKMKLLQKHQVFEAEILAHGKIIDSVQQVRPFAWCFKMACILWYVIAWECANDRSLAFTLFSYTWFYPFIQTGEELVSLRHPKSKEVKQSVSALISHWEALKEAISARGKVLEGHRDFLEFLQKVEQVEVWIRQKVRKTSFRLMFEDLKFQGFSGKMLTNKTAL